MATTPTATISRIPLGSVGPAAPSPKVSPRGGKSPRSTSYSRLTRLSIGSSSTVSAGNSPAYTPSMYRPTGNAETLIRELQNSSTFKGKEAAVAALCNLSLDAEGQLQVIGSGAVPVLVQVLSADWADPTMREGAAATLYNLASDDNGRLAIESSGGIDALVNMLEDPSSEAETRQLVTAILRLLVSQPVCKKSIINTRAIEALVQVMKSMGEKEDTPEAKLNAISVMQSLSFTDEHVAIDWGKRGVLAALIQFMEQKSPLRAAQSTSLGSMTPCKSPRSVALATAATVLQNLSVYEENKGWIVGAGGVRTMLTLTSEYRADIGVQTAAASVLFNLAVSAQCCPVILQEGAVPALLETLREHPPSTELRKFAAGTLHYLSATEEGASALQVAMSTIDATGSMFVQNLLGDEEPEDISRHLAGLARNLTSIPGLLPIALVQRSVVPGIIQQLRRSYTYDTKEEYLIGALHNLAFKNDSNKVIVAAAGGIDVALRLLAFGSLKAGALERLAALTQTLTVAPENEMRFAPGLQQFLGLALSENTSMKAREFVMGTVQNASVHPDNKLTIVQTGGIALMLATLRDKGSSQTLCECALGVLQNLSNVATLKPKVAESTVLKAVMNRLGAKEGRHPSGKEKEYGMGILLNVSVLENARAQLVALGAISLMIRFINSTVTNICCKQYSAVGLHRLCCRHDDLLVNIRREGGALALGRVLDQLPDPAAQECVRWTLHRLEAAVA